MNKEEIIDNKKKVFSCSKNMLSLTGRENNQMDCILCFCGSIHCQILPTIVNEVNTCQLKLFLEYKSDAFKKWIPQEDPSKTSLYVPAEGIQINNRFEGTCGVCGIKYLDYNYHISEITHKDKIYRNTFNQYILELCESVYEQVHVHKKKNTKNQLRIYGQFARKDRGNKKAKYRNKRTGKFTFKMTINEQIRML